MPAQPIIHLGTWNRDLIEAVISEIPKYENKSDTYLATINPYSFTILPDGEFAAFLTKIRIVPEDLKKIRHLIADRIHKTVLNKKCSFNSANSAYINARGERSTMRYPINVNKSGKQSFDVDTIVAFNCFYKVNSFDIDRKLVNCLVDIISGNMTVAKLKEKYGEDAYNETVGMPRNPIEIAKNQWFEKEFTEIVSDYDDNFKKVLNETKDKISTSGIFAKTYNRKLHEQILKEYDAKINELSNDCFKKVSELRVKFGI